MSGPPLVPHLALASDADKQTTMATAFIGLPVRIRLKGDPSSELTGVLSALDPVAGSLTLTEGAQPLRLGS